MKCFYHNDPDGICAGFWIRQLYPGGEFLPINYGQVFPFDSIRPDEKVYIVDYSIEPHEMERLLSITTDVVWIDHHVTAIEKYANFPHEIPGLRYDGIAGCMLAYCHVQAIRSVSDSALSTLIESAPLFTKLIADWDVWTFEYGEDTRRFQTAFVSLNMRPDSIYWEHILRDEPTQELMLSSGESMLSFRDGWAASYLSLGFFVEFEGYRCFALNLGRCNSDYFKSLREACDIFMPFVYDGESWTVSLYSKTVDVSVIAKKYGGGGHKGASGFQCAELPFRKGL